MFDLLQIFIVLIFVCGVTAGMAAALYEIVATWFNFRGRYFYQRTEEFSKTFDVSQEQQKLIQQATNKLLLFENTSPPSGFLNRIKSPENRVKNKISEESFVHLCSQNNSIGIDKKTLKIKFRDFNQSLSVRYRRKVMRHLFIPGLLLAVTFNIDLIEIAKHLKNQAELDDKITKIKTYVDSLPSSEQDTIAVSIYGSLNLLDEYNIPFGWKKNTHNQYDIDSLKILKELKEGIINQQWNKKCQGEFSPESIISLEDPNYLKENVVRYSHKNLKEEIDNKLTNSLLCTKIRVYESFVECTETHKTNPEKCICCLLEIDSISAGVIQLFDTTHYQTFIATKKFDEKDNMLKYAKSQQEIMKPLWLVNHSDSISQALANKQYRLAGLKAPKKVSDFKFWFCQVSSFTKWFAFILLALACMLGGTFWFDLIKKMLR